MTTEDNMSETNVSETNVSETNVSETTNHAEEAYPMTIENQSQESSTESATAEAKAAIAAEAAAFNPAKFVSMNLDVAGAAGRVLAHAARIHSLLPQMDEQVAVFDRDRIVNIRLYATVALEAHLRAMEPEAPTPALVEECYQIREDLLGSAESAVRFGYVTAARVAAIREGTGHRDLANDLIQLARLWDEIWDRVKDRVFFGRDHVDRAAALGIELQEKVGGRDADADPTAPNSVEYQRAAAFSVLVRAYDECRRMVSFLRWRQGDLESIAPSLYARRRRRAGVGEEEVGDAPPDSAGPVSGSAE